MPCRDAALATPFHPSKTRWTAISRLLAEELPLPRCRAASMPPRGVSSLSISPKSTQVSRDCRPARTRRCCGWNGASPAGMVSVNGNLYSVLQAPDHLSTNGAVNAHPAERDAWIAAVIQMPATAVITPGASVRTTVGDVQLAAAMAAAQQARQQCLATPYRSSAGEASTIGVVADQTLVSFELGPVNVTVVAVGNQNLPRLSLLAEAPHDALATGLDDATSGAPESVSASLDRVGQHVMQCVVDWQLPGDAPAFRGVFYRWQWQSFLAHPQLHLPYRLQYGELGEHQRNCLLHASVRILLEAVVRRIATADQVLNNTEAAADSMGWPTAPVRLAGIRRSDRRRFGPLRFWNRSAGLREIACRVCEGRVGVAFPLVLVDPRQVSDRRPAPESERGVTAPLSLTSSLTTAIYRARPNRHSPSSSRL
jgi:hypothetical protein